jgi:hypothetical protein
MIYGYHCLGELRIARIRATNWWGHANLLNIIVLHPKNTCYQPN